MAALRLNSAFFNLPTTSQIHITIPILIISNNNNNNNNIAPQNDVVVLPSPRHSILAFTIQTLLAFLQIQTLQLSPFQLYPLTTAASVLTVLAYYLSFRAKLCLPSYASQLTFLMSLLGSFLVASLASLLLPQCLGHFRYFLYVLLVVAECCSCLTSMYHRYASWRRQPPRMRVARRRLLPQTYMDLVGPRRR